jgi:recombination protein RecR
MDSWPAAVERLARELGRLPGVGRRSAVRLTHHLLRCPPEDALALAQALATAREEVRPCLRCGNYAQDELCPLCLDPRRDQGLVCIVEKPSDIGAFEATGRFQGVYHVLGALLSPLDGIGPVEMGADRLRERIASGTVRELVLAVPASTEGEATSLYISRIAHGHAVQVTRLARGLPAGGGIEYSDALTVLQAFEGRIPA